MHVRRVGVAIHEGVAVVMHGVWPHRRTVEIPDNQG